MATGTLKHIFDPSKAETLCGEQEGPNQLKYGYLWTDNNTVWVEDASWPHHHRVGKVVEHNDEFICHNYGRSNIFYVCPECYALSKLISFKV